jgi:hypothetical protein
LNLTISPSLTLELGPSVMVNYPELTLHLTPYTPPKESKISALKSFSHRLDVFAKVTSIKLTTPPTSIIMFERSFENVASMTPRLHVVHFAVPN